QTGRSRVESHICPGEARARCGYLLMLTGTPEPMRAAIQLIELLASRMQPCDSAVPSCPPRFSTPWMAIWPGPPSNSWNTFERSLVASAYGPPGWPAERVTFSSTKYSPIGVGVDGLPTIA